MIDPELMAILRCPNQPSQRLVEKGDCLVCERCDLRFKIRDGFPILVVEEAELPVGCSSLSDLPCQRTTTPAVSS